jgi:LysM repeat protein
MHPKKRALIPLLLAAIILAACASAQPTETPAPTVTPTLRLYHTPTLTSTATPPAVLSPTPTATATITPTPVTYQVAKNDDMYGIAFFFGISPQALMTANPTVNPRAMSIGTELIIPITPSAPENTPTQSPATPTPLPVKSLPVRCYAVADGGFWCLMLASNETGQALENLTGKIRLTGADGTLVDRDAFAPLNLLPPGESLPLAARFLPPLPQDFTASGEVLSALPQPENDARYLPVTLLDPETVIQPGGRSKRVTGAVALAAAEGTAQRVWLALTAYAADGSPAGVRKWEAPEGLAAGESLPFDLTVYSLGPEISGVQVMVEALAAVEE